MLKQVKSHFNAVKRAYTLHYPAHPPRAGDPHRHDFEEYKRRRRDSGTWWCDFGKQYRDDETECDLKHPLECHHSVIEFAVQNGVDLARLEHYYPGVSKQGIGQWIDTAPNLKLLCRWHHRGHGGVHIVSASDWEAYKYVKGLIS